MLEILTLHSKYCQKQKQASGIETTTLISNQQIPRRRPTRNEKVYNLLKHTESSQKRTIYKSIKTNTNRSIIFKEHIFAAMK